jgi:hypothetical protein
MQRQQSVLTVFLNVGDLRESLTLTLGTHRGLPKVEDLCCCFAVFAAVWPGVPVYSHTS